jgi:hypothetical protein
MRKHPFKKGWDIKRGTQILQVCIKLEGHPAIEKIKKLYERSKRTCCLKKVYVQHAKDKSKRLNTVSFAGVEAE